MAKPAFIYAFDNLGPYRFTELCGLLLGSRFRGFFLGGVGADGGIDGEIDTILGEWRPEVASPLIQEVIQLGQGVVFQFKHKVCARVGQANARTQLLNLYNCTAKKTCELHSKLVLERDPAAYVLITNVEVNAQFRAAFIEQCKRHNPRIQHYQVIGLDDLEAWVSMESELRHLYFPTIFGLPRFDLRIAFSVAFPGYFSGFSVPAIDSDTVMLAISILNVGTVTSYVSTISIEVLIDGERKPLNILDFGETFTSHMNPKSGTPLEPGRRQTYYYRLSDLGESLKMHGNHVFPTEFHVQDEIGNIYREPFPQRWVEELLEHIQK